MSLTAAAAALMLASPVPDSGASAVTAAETAPPEVQAQPATPASPQLPTEPVIAAGESPGTASAPVADAAQADDDIVVSHRKPSDADPLERINVESFKSVQAVDKAVLEPVAKGYNKGLPRPVRQGLRNFFTNLQEPVVAVAYLLELKPGKAFETGGRFLVNSTLGVAGLMDVAKRKPFNLPYRPNGVADLLGYYGVGPGPYFYLPLIGPTTLRDIIGDTVDRMAVPFAIGKPLTSPAYVIPSTILSQLGERAAFDETVGKIRDADDPYATYREMYLKQRKAEIDALHGRVTPDVVPVYGPGMKTAVVKKKSAEALPASGPEAAPLPAVSAQPEAAPEAPPQPEVSPQP